MNSPDPHLSEYENLQHFYKHWNKTATFDLGPLHKPDMSPYLVHLTGRNEILSILQGKTAPVDLSDQPKGFLKASIPKQSTPGNYEAYVVCFTESPTFALDFFRRRVPDRWLADQRYGIGFSKASLIYNRVGG